jgi:hypothetical protein
MILRKPSFLFLMGIAQYFPHPPVHGQFINPVAKVRESEGSSGIEGDVNAGPKV